MMKINDEHNDNSLVVDEVIALMNKVQDREANTMDKERLAILMDDIREKRPDLVRRWELDEAWLEAFRTLDEINNGHRLSGDSGEHRAFVSSVLDRWESEKEEAEQVRLNSDSFSSPALKLVKNDDIEKTYEAESVAASIASPVDPKRSARQTVLWFKLAVAAVILFAAGMSLEHLIEMPNPPQEKLVLESPETEKSQGLIDGGIEHKTDTPPITIVATRQVSFNDVWNAPTNTHRDEQTKKSPLGGWISETTPKLEKNLVANSTVLFGKSISVVSSLPEVIDLDKMNLVNELIES